MGLAAPRKKTKISHDPNNNNWARSTSNYGHKIMSRQGWTPGDTLGIKDSAHSRHFTSASYTHIRVSRKDDTLGLGARARRPLEDNEPTGLDAFQGLLGRLNGKSDVELHKEQRKREDRKLMSYVERRWKTMQFVSGGLLVQEKPAVSLDNEKEASDATSQPSKPKEQKEEKEEKKEKKTKKDKKESKKDRKDRKQKKDRRKKESSSSSSDSSDDRNTDEATSSAVEDSKSIEKSKSRKDKDKAKKRKAGEEESATKERETETESRLPQSASQSPAPIPVPPRQLKGRHVLRGRHIQSKRMAILDDKSLNEIFMVKAKA